MRLLRLWWLRGQLRRGAVLEEIVAETRVFSQKMSTIRELDMDLGISLTTADILHGLVSDRALLEDILKAYRNIFNERADEEFQKVAYDLWSSVRLAYLLYG